MYWIYLAREEKKSDVVQLKYKRNRTTERKCELMWKDL